MATKRKPAAPKFIAAESIYTWAYRGVQIFIALVLVLWFSFGFYSDVQNMKSDLATVKTDILKLFTGQTTNAEILSRIEKAVAEKQ